MSGKEAKTLAELAAIAAGRQPQQIAGKPADVCPYCGCAMFAHGTRQGEQMTFRYVHCRNPQCGRRFMSKQPPATLVREISELPSSSGQSALQVFRGSA
jgi:hypothetical protein